MKTKKQKLKLEELRERVGEITGFDAVSRLGTELGARETKIILDYSEMRGADRKYVANVLEQKGRPYDLFCDPTFKNSCFKCRKLRNYCCC